MKNFEASESEVEIESIDEMKDGMKGGMRNGIKYGMKDEMDVIRDSADQISYVTEYAGGSLNLLILIFFCLYKFEQGKASKDLEKI